MKTCLLKLVLIISKNAEDRDCIEFISTCIKAGVTSVQLREKHMSGNALLSFGLQVKVLLDRLNIALIVNDSLELCMSLDAHGLHLGQKDCCIHFARATLGPKKILGLTTNNLAQVETANNLPIDYIGLGPIFPSKNKPDAEMIWGIESLKHASSISIHPIVAIGGINENNASLVMEAGASGIAAISAFYDTESPELAAQNLSKIVNERRIS